jgi:KRAB domain-containing zinc finger protein
MGVLPHWWSSIRGNDEVIMEPDTIKERENEDGIKLEETSEISEHSLKVIELSQECPHCSKIFTTNKRMNCHVALEHNPNNKYSMVVMKTENKGVDHKIASTLFIKRTHQRGTKRKSCRKCKIEFSSDELLKEHIDGHKVIKKLICDHCGHKVSCGGNLKAHNLKMHASEEEKEAARKFVCPTCGRRFYTKSPLIDHQLLHSETVSFFCDLCGAGYKNNSSLTGHKRQHRVKHDEAENAKNRLRRMKKRERIRQKEGMTRTPEERIKHKEYMKKYMEKRKLMHKTVNQE